MVTAVIVCVGGSVMARGLFDCGGYADAKTFNGARTFKLEEHFLAANARRVYKIMAHTPLPSKGLQIHERARNVLVRKYRFVMLQHFGTHLSILRFGDGILRIDFLKAIESPNYTVDLGEGIEEILLGGRVGELDFLKGISRALTWTEGATTVPHRD